MKPSIGSFPDPTTGQEAATKAFADEALAGLHASRGDYLAAYMSASRTADDLAAGTVVEFDTIRNSRGELDVDAVTNIGRVSGLKAGRTYYLQVSLVGSGAGSNWIFYGWHNVTANVEIGSEGQEFAMNFASSQSGNTAAAIITPAVDTEVEVRVRDRDSATRNISGLVNGSHIEIFEIGANVISAAGDYIHAHVTGNSAPGAGAPLELDTVLSSRGGLSLDGVTNVGRFSGLKAGRTYRLHAVGRTLASSTGDIQWRDLTAAAYIGNTTIIRPMNSGVTTSSQPVAIAFITPTVDTEVELWSRDGVGTFNDYTHASIEELGARASAVVSSAKALVNETTLTLSGLDGDADGEYEISGTLILALSAHDVNIAPNGDSLNLTHRSQVNGVNATAATGLLVNSASTSTKNRFTFKMRARVARTLNGVTIDRTFIVEAIHVYGTTTTLNQHDVVIAYDDSASNLTSIDYTCTVASGFLAGSEIIVRRID